jgi:hypothetical protein
MRTLYRLLNAHGIPHKPTIASTIVASTLKKLTIVQLEAANFQQKQLSFNQKQLSFNQKQLSFNQKQRSFN